MGEDRVLWGTDAIWYGSPQPQLMGFRAFEISANPASGLPSADNLAWWEALLLAFLGGVVLNGAAARLVHTGDRVIVISYATYDEAELARYEPKVVHVDDHNRIVVPALAAVDGETEERAS